jgi:Mor family transcriptional regulator
MRVVNNIPEINAIINDNVRSERNRGILRRVMVDGISYERTAEEYAVCRNTIYNVMRKHRQLFK